MLASNQDLPRLCVKLCAEDWWRERAWKNFVTCWTLITFHGHGFELASDWGHPHTHACLEHVWAWASVDTDYVMLYTIGIMDQGRKLIMCMSQYFPSSVILQYIVRVLFCVRNTIVRFCANAQSTNFLTWSITWSITCTCVRMYWAHGIWTAS